MQRKLPQDQQNFDALWRHLHLLYHDNKADRIKYMQILENFNMKHFDQNDTMDMAVAFNEVELAIAGLSLIGDKQQDSTILAMIPPKLPKFLLILT